ncbi:MULTISPECIES: hypothetical protein [Peribacillus]|uniref:hypothetical protein n=1 Tax=Peribacillus TaxID=2675229 RepID=UPI001F4EE441|nr:MULTISPECIES: hypothetical protein [unclassified Peribacillus]MCK1985759.1 hypothetical protein [Peribacillus sp. Aquil_B1]MCK2010685.1 hypothetical protein [Peribacillus sp. Aquil_B8]
MTLKEFIEFQEGIAIGEEYSFIYQNEEYWISQNPGSYYLTRVRGAYTQEFKTSEALFKYGTIEEKLLSEIYMDFEW